MRLAIWKCYVGTRVWNMYSNGNDVKPGAGRCKMVGQTMSMRVLLGYMSGITRFNWAQSEATGFTLEFCPRNDLRDTPSLPVRVKAVAA